MEWLKIIVGVSNALLLLAGVAVWASGAVANNASRKRFGATLLSAWLVYDLITVILAWNLGWFA